MTTLWPVQRKQHTILNKYFRITYRKRKVEGRNTVDLILRVVVTNLIAGRGEIWIFFTYKKGGCGMFSIYSWYPQWNVEPQLQLAALNCIIWIMSNVVYLKQIDQERYQIKRNKEMLTENRNYNCWEIKNSGQASRSHQV